MKILFVYNNSKDCAEYKTAQNNIQCLKDLGHEITELKVQQELQKYSVIRKVIRALIWLFSGGSRLFAEYLYRKYLPKLEIINDRKNYLFDLVVLNYAFNASYVLHLSAPKILITNDILFLNNASKHKDNYRLGYWFEKRILKKMDKIVSLSEHERKQVQLLFQLDSTPIYTYINSAPDKTVKVSEPLDETVQPTKKLYDLFFIGDSHMLNMQSLGWFYENVYKKYLEADNITFHVVGRCGPAYFQGLNYNKDLITVSGHVDSLDEAYAQTKICILPCQGGTGISGKVAECFYYGNAFVGTSIALRGIESIPSFNDSLEFSNEIKALLKDKVKFNKRQEKSKELYEQYYSYNTAVKKWAEVLYPFDRNKL